MAPKFLSKSTALAVTFAILLAFLPAPVFAGSLENTLLPSLVNFVHTSQNGEGDSLVGVYADGVFALAIAEQPGYNAGFVSTADGTVTHFKLADQFGVTGLLAHNYLAGQSFFSLTQGQKIHLVYGDGRFETFFVARVLRYQALDPYNPYSNFVDLESGRETTANSLFMQVYSGSRHVTFQTCIEKDGNSSWGRLFVIAEPVASEEEMSATNLIP